MFNVHIIIFTDINIVLFQYAFSNDFILWMPEAWKNCQTNPLDGSDEVGSSTTFWEYVIYYAHTIFFIDLLDLTVFNMFLIFSFLVMWLTSTWSNGKKTERTDVWKALFYILLASKHWARLSQSTHTNLSTYHL